MVSSGIRFPFLPAPLVIRQIAAAGPDFDMMDPACDLRGCHARRARQVMTAKQSGGWSGMIADRGAN